MEDDPLPEVRTMNSLIALPNGKVLCLNGAETGKCSFHAPSNDLSSQQFPGAAGIGIEPWTVGESLADKPVLKPVIYDPNAPAGHRWSSEGVSPSTIPRMYHSSALLLPDGR